jgi:hypothetical protein
VKATSAERVDEARRRLYEGRLSPERYAAMVRRAANTNSSQASQSFSRTQVFTATVLLAAIAVAVAALAGL